MLTFKRECKGNPVSRVSDHEYFMGIALDEAREALKSGEVPVGAVVVYNGAVVGRGRNSVMCISWADGGGGEGVDMRGGDPTAHAEIVAIRDAVSRIGGKNNYRLEGAELYVTIEPCIMCAGAIIQARLKKLIYGAPDIKAGAVDSLYKILGDERLNHRVEVTGGILEEEARRLIQDFFKERR
ncbi:MAG: nucleoside deaminase [Deltaproteobacteria bacterium]|uniref:tRNA-specific adenosine deaminase n=1 Tax=Candidatus Zymogenus saltonus TaxID=2844893 RepID=A0A9D8PNY1_9DELT|nr:nucleoside deaminase [Candidatus Zymogenus saltonus]